MEHSPCILMARIARAVSTVGTDAFPEALTALCQSAFAFDSLFVSLFSQDHAPRQLYSNLNDEATRCTIGPYLSFAYLLDPFYGLFKSDVGTTVVGLDECAPDDFRSTEYYRVFYSDTGLRDEVTIFAACGDANSIVLSLGQRAFRRPRTSEACDGLKALLPVIAALCTKHWPDLTGHPITAGPSFDRLDMPKLSLREAEIVRLMLKGHSTKSMARLLGNSPETVKVHRKRIYSKLGICSQGELFARFLGTQDWAPMGQTAQEQALLLN